MFWVHPILAALVVGMVISTAFLGWYYHRNRTPGARTRHVCAGKFLLGALGLLQLLGLGSVVLAGRPGIPPGASGHFWAGAALLSGYGVSAILMLRWGTHRWARRFHMTVNTLLVAVVLYTSATRRESTL